MHVASPYVIANPKLEDEMIVPALEGTLRVLNAAQKAGVKRVVLTSSIVAMLEQMLRGKLPMLPNISIPLVDVRDVASLHVLAMTADNVVGKRIIAAPAKASSFIEIAQILKDQGYKDPSTRMAPNFVLHFMALFDREAKGMLDTHIAADNTETLSLLNWSFRSLKESVLDSAMVVNTLIKKD